MPADIQVPPSSQQRFAEYIEKNGMSIPHPDSKEWHTKEAEQKAKDRNLFWAAPYDARFPQVRKQRHCFAYYVDYHRCSELMGADYKPCQFFQNVYKDVCPKFWVEKWDELTSEGRFPAKFDR